MANKEILGKWVLRSRKGPDITVNGQTDTMEGFNVDIVKRWGAEFQQDFCASCLNYNRDGQDFIEKGHPNNPQDCKSHWTDIVGICFNYRERDTGKTIDQLVQDLKTA